MGKHRRDRTSQRDANDVATDSEVLREFIQKPKPYRPIVAPALHLPTFDTRKFHPDPIRPISDPRSAAKLTVPRESAVRRSGGRSDPPERTAARGKMPAQVQFQAPQRVSVCVRRKTRREVLFAKAKTGKGARAPRSRNSWSDVKC